MKAVNLAALQFSALAGWIVPIVYHFQNPFSKVSNRFVAPWPFRNYSPRLGDVFRGNCKCYSEGEQERTEQRDMTPPPPSVPLSWADAVFCYLEIRITTESK